ncbi:MAG: alpha/beta hydrolase [Thermomonospora sp. CIF 1]|nr:MAG: alpha/beta hydrolase [Thermomonospora sp. CIF 1]
MILSPRSLRSAAVNVASMLLNGQLADLSPMPADRLGEGSGRAVLRYRFPEWLVPAGPPVLLVPSPGVPARCYDLRRGGSLVEHVVDAGRLTYLLEGPAGPADPRAGAAQWAGEILPSVIRRVSSDAGGQPVQLVGWSLGGTLALLTAAADPSLPIASVAAIAPATGAGLPGTVDQIIAAGHGLLRAYHVLARIDDRDHLAQREALDRFAAALRAHPGRGLTESYAAYLGAALAGEEELSIGGREVSLARIGVPVLAIAGDGDRIAPPRAVRDLTLSMVSSPRVRFEIASGDHLGVLTGGQARTTTWTYLDRWLDEGILRHGLRPHHQEEAAAM